MIGAGTVTASAPPDRSVVVYFISSNTNKLVAPAPAIIPAGQTSAQFTIAIVDDARVDGPQTATLTAHVENWIDGSATMMIFDNESPPPVSVSREGGKMLLSWPGAYAGFSVESTTNLGGTIAWVGVTNRAQIVNGRFSVTLDPVAGPQFFRLKKP